MNQYEEPSTPELEDLQQHDESEEGIKVPVIVKEIGPVQTHALPARDAVMRRVTAVPGAAPTQLVGKDLRRSSLTVWAQGEADGDVITIGVDKNEVESDTAARIFATSVGSLAAGNTIRMTHCMPVWVTNNGVNPVDVSFIAEYWAD